MTKHEERTVAIQALYSLSFTKVATEKELESIFRASLDACRTEDPTEEISPVFAWELTKGTWEHTQEIDRLLEKYSRKRSLGRVGRMERVLLSMALYELVFLNIKPPIIKKESDILGQEFGLQESRAYISGILDAAAKDLARPAANEESQ